MGLEYSFKLSLSGGSADFFLLLLSFLPFFASFLCCFKSCFSCLSLSLRSFLSDFAASPARASRVSSFFRSPLASSRVFLSNEGCTTQGQHGEHDRFLVPEAWPSSVRSRNRPDSVAWHSRHCFQQEHRHRWPRRKRWPTAYTCFVVSLDRWLVLPVPASCGAGTRRCAAAPQHPEGEGRP